MKALVREESEQHVVRRLEAFSDIVIGFSLAMLTMDLALPAHAIALFTSQPEPLVGFIATFFFVAVFWWSNHRVFTYYFVPTTLDIILSFMTLAGVLFFTYSLQVLLHTGMRDGVAYAMYVGTIGYVVLINGVLIWRGVVLRGRQMDSDILLRGRRRALSGMLLAAMLIPSAIFVGVFGIHGIAFGLLPLYVFAAGAVSSLVYRRRTLSRPSA